MSHELLDTGDMEEQFVVPHFWPVGYRHFA